jgi:Histidine kinase-like ATPase domain
MASPPDMTEKATVELSFTPLPAHVRTARLVATAVARRSGVEESLLDEVRLAVGEACSRAVEAHRMHCPSEPVRIQLSDRGGRFEVVVADAVPRTAVDAAAMRAAVGAASAGSRVADTGPQQDVLQEEAPQREAAGAPSPAGGPSAGPAAETARAAATGTVQNEPAAGDAGGDLTAGGAGTANGGLPADIGLAVIAGLADDVRISATGGGVSIRMSWPTA